MSTDSVPELSPEEVSRRLKEFRIVDVRRPDEFNGELGHISGAVLSTLESQFEKDLEGFSKDLSYVFVCRSGARSGNATSMASSKGFKNVYNMKGGMIAWNHFQLPVERS